MKTTLLITLKTLEVAGGAVVYLGLCGFGYWLDLSLGDPIAWTWYNPYYFLVSILFFFILTLVTWVVYITIKELFPLWINLNKKWVGKILKK